MMNRLSKWLAWTIVALQIVIAAIDAVVTFQNTVNAGEPVDLVYWLDQAAVIFEPVAFTIVGAFVVTRRPGNRVGWLLAVIGMSFTCGTLTTDYPGISAQTHRPTRPLGDFVAWMSTWDFFVYLAALLLLFLLFPTGELPSRRWKPLLWIGLMAWVGFGATAAVQPGPIESNLNQPMNNPYAIAGFPSIVTTAFTICGLATLAAAALSLILRFRTARGDVRQQLKWFTYGASVAIPFDIATVFTGTYNTPFGLVALIATTAAPISIGVAVLRYRLYDIDVLINRTLVYGSLSALLGLLYLGGVVSLQALFRTITNASSDLAVAISTLAIAALFQPLRRLIQSFIDRRFYRRKYDATRTLATFQTRLKDEVNLDDLTGDLVGVVQDTMQPAHVSLWLREARTKS